MPRRAKISLQSLRTKLNKQAETARHQHFADLCEMFALPRPTLEFRFALPTRQFRFDFAWIPQKLALEVDGGIWTRGSHGRGTGIVQSYDKQNAATLLGWRVLKTQPRVLCTAATVDLVRQALNSPNTSDARRKGENAAPASDIGPPPSV